MRSSWLSSSSKSSLALLSLLVCFLAVAAQEHPGDACSTNNRPGTCKILRECTPIYNALLAGIRPKDKLCGYSGFQPVVCCPNDGKVVTPAPPIKPSTPTPVAKPKPKPLHPLVNTGVGSIARAKCAEYAQSVYALQAPPTLTSNRELVNISLCAVKSRKLIIGGKDADPKEFPHMAVIGAEVNGEKKWFCGGSLVSTRFILSAAHCTFAGEWGPAVWARVGDLNIYRTDDTARPQDRRIIQRIRHSKFKKPPFYHDISLFKLETPVTFDAFVRPACLPTKLPDVEIQGENSYKAVATGWGRVSLDTDDLAADLQKVTLDMVPPDTCNASFTGYVDPKIPNGLLKGAQLCAGSDGKDTCQGDSGGPLAVFNTDHECMYNVVGITSFGSLCGLNIPAVYTRVYFYLEWLEANIWAEDE